MNRKYWIGMATIAISALGISCFQVQAQAATPSVEPEFIQQAQTVHIPLNAIHRQTTLPVKDLTEPDVSLKVDGQPRPCRLSRPWTRTTNPTTGQPHDRPNLLIILPLAGPEDRQNVLNHAIEDFSKEPNLGWNISILDDGGNQTLYTRDLKTVVDELRKIESENSVTINLGDWRTTATLAITNMRDLPGRRVVLTLGDIYHVMVIDQGELVYENFQVNDVATAARNVGAVIYAAESSQEIGRLRGLSPHYSVAGSGPWLLLTGIGDVAGWITNSVSDTMQQIRQDSMGAYDIDLHLSLKEMDGQPHLLSIVARQPEMILNAPPYYIAPDLAQLQELSKVFPALRQALKNTPPAGSSPLQLAIQLAYFPHSDGKTGTQIATTGFFWTQTTPPPAQMDVALQLEQTSSGFMMNTTIGGMQWLSEEPVWKTAIDVGPGAYRLRVAAADASGKISAATDTPFTVEPTTNEGVLISSLVLGKTCVFAPQPAGQKALPKNIDYLRAGNCDLQPDPSHYYSPQDIVWTLVRITPVGKLASRPSKDWKASFVMIDARGSKLAEQPVRWLTAEDGSFIATTAFPLGDPKLKLTDGEYAVVLRLKGPGIDHDYGEDAPFMVYGASSASSKSKR